MLFQRLSEVPAPSVVVVVVDASNLERNLYFATQVIELGYATIIALNMVDVAEENGQTIDTGRLADGVGRAGDAHGGQQRRGRARSCNRKSSKPPAAGKARARRHGRFARLPAPFAGGDRGGGQDAGRNAG